MWHYPRSSKPSRKYVFKYLNGHLLFMVSLSLALSAILFTLTGRIKNQPIHGIENNIPYATSVTAQIGVKNPFTIFGYTSPYALVSLETRGHNQDTYANKEGYFEFYNDLRSKFSNEICLSSRDQFGRLTAQTCIPSLPPEPNIRIGPILLSPTLSLDKLTYFISDTIIFSGQSIPNTNVELSIFKGFALPPLEVRADEGGNYSVMLPSSDDDKYRVFTRTDFLEQASPKSNTLIFTVNPLWAIILVIIKALWQLLSSHLMEFIIVVELFIIVWHRLHLWLHKRKRHFELAIYRRPDLVRHTSYLPTVFQPSNDIVPY